MKPYWLNRNRTQRQRTGVHHAGLLISAGVLFAITSLTGCGQSTTVDNGSSATIPVNRSTPVASTNLAASKTLHYEVEGETDSANAHLYVSANQPLYLYLLDKYQASAGKSGTDRVTFNLNSKAWMRIQVLSADLQQSVWEQQAKHLLSATDADVQPLPSNDLPNGAFFANCKAFIANSSATSAIVFLGHLNGHPVQVFLHLPREWESPAQFEAMMATLHLTNA